MKSYERLDAAKPAAGILWYMMCNDNISTLGEAAIGWVFFELRSFNKVKIDTAALELKA